MRITGGMWRGRILKVPKGDAVRPTQDRVREALFSILQNDIQEKTFLDLFAGSGATGLEALSRGAKHVTFVELAPRHIATLKENAQALDAACEVVKADAYNWIATAGCARQFDIVFADPPYELALARGWDEILNVLSQKKVIAAGGLFIAEMRATQKAPESPAWDLCRDRVYGQTRLAIYRLCDL